MPWLLLLALLSAAPSTRSERWAKPDARDRRLSRVIGPHGLAPAAAFILTAFDYSWPWAGSRFPACADDATCVAVCGIGVRTGSATACECKGHDGAALGVVTDPGGTNITAFTGGGAREISHLVNDGCSVVSSTIDSAFPANAGASTIVTAIMSRTNAGAVDYLWERTGGTSGFNWSRFESGDWKWFGNTTAATYTAGVIADAWTVEALTRSAAVTPSFVQYSQASTHATAGAGAETVISGTGGWTFGNRSAQDLGLNGPWIYTAFYTEAKTAAQLASIREKLWGSYTAAGAITAGGLVQTVGEDNTATSGNVDLLATGANLITSDTYATTVRGLRSFKGYTNSWAADPLAAATWTAVDGGLQSASAGSTAGGYNASCYAQAGSAGVTTNQFSLSFQTGGDTSIGSCRHTLDGGARYVCQTIVTAPTDGGTIGTVKASVVMNGAGPVPVVVTSNVSSGPFAVWKKAAECDQMTQSDGGQSIRLCQCQISQTLAADPPTTDNAAHGDVYYSSTSAASWPDPTLGGKYELIHTPLYDPNSTWVDANSAYYALDVTSAADADHTVAIVFGYTVAGRLNGVIRGPGGEVGDLLVNGVALTPGQPYATSVSWRPVGGGNCNTYLMHDSCGATAIASCHATTIVASDVTGTAKCPGTPAKVTFGARYNIGIINPLITNALRVYSL